MGLDILAELDGESISTYARFNRRLSPSYSGPYLWYILYNLAWSLR